MTRAARTRVDAPGTTRAFHWGAHPSRRHSRNGRSKVTALSLAPRRRQTQRAVAAMLGSALLSFALVVESHAQTRIGRLFSGPDQRMELDRLRSDTDFGAPAEPIVDPAGPDSRSDPEGGTTALAVTFNGLVVRSDGHRVAWIDGVETAPGATTATGVRIEAHRAPGARLGVRLPDGRTSAVLEPGQSIDADGRMRDAYEHRPVGIAAGVAGRRLKDSGGSDEGADAGAPVGLPGSDSPPGLPADVVQEFLRAARAVSAPLGEGESEVPSAGDG